MKQPLFIALVALLSAGAANAQIVKNGDFSNARAHWEGAGQVAVLDNNQKPAAGGVPQLLVTLNRNIVQETKQRLMFKANEIKGKANITVVLKTSADYERNDKCARFNVNWTTGGWYTWSALVYPNVDFCVRVDSDTHYYLPRGLKAGGDWQTLRGEFNSLGNPSMKTLALVFPAGSGTIWVKSVSLDVQ